MAYNRLSLTKQDNFDIGTIVHAPLYNPEHKQIDAYSSTNDKIGRISRLIHQLYAMFKHKEAKHELKSGINIDMEKNQDEQQSLLDLENCANAARKADDAGQYEWD